MVLRTLTGTSLFALVLTGAVAAPLYPPADGTLPPPSIFAVRATPPTSNGDVTGSLGGTGLASAGQQTVLLRSAISAYDGGDLTQGDTLARSLTDPAAKAAAEWIAIRTAARQVGYRRISSFLSAYPNWPAAATVRRRAEEALYNDDVDDAIVRGFFAGQKPLTDEGKVALAAALLHAGDQKGASALIRDAYRNDGLSGTLEGDILKDYSKFLSKADLKFRADRLIYAGNYTDGLRAATRAGGDALAVAKAQIAVAKGARNADALLAAAAGAGNDPAYLFARISRLRKNDKIKEAAALLAKAPREAASLVAPDEWWVERRLVARDLLDKGEFRAAYIVVSGYTADSDQAKMEADFHCGWIALRFLGDAKTAARHFAALSAEAERPISLSRGAYWQGRAAEALGDSAAARKFYEQAGRYSTTYYGQIARARTGARGLDLRALPQPGSAERVTFNSLLATRAIAQLYAVGRRDFARILVSDMANRLDDSDQLALLGDLALRNSDAKAALSVGKSATQRGMPLEMIAFPTNGIPSFTAVGDVERAVVFGIARQESEFGHDVVSGAGARGLMQVMPATAKATAKAAGLAFDPKRLTSDPAYNAQIGQAHLGELIDKYNGSYIMTFAAYNAGGSRVAEWVKTYGDPRDPKIDPIDWVERIPFTETRNYVQRVMENVQVYRTRLGGKTAQLIDADLKRGR